MDKHADNVRRQLSELSDLAAKTEAAERKILEAAEAQLEQVNSRIQELRPSALLDSGSSDEYQKLVADRARLNVVIAQARKHLAV